MTHLYCASLALRWSLQYVDNSRLAQMKNDKDERERHNTMLKIHVFRELLLSFTV